jgi:hypothetical protein
MVPKPGIRQSRPDNQPPNRNLDNTHQETSTTNSSKPNQNKLYLPMHTHDSPSERSSPKSKNSTTPPQSIPQPRRHTIKASKGAEASVSLSYRHIHSFPFPHIIKHNSQPRPCCPLLAVVVTHPPIPQRFLSHPSFSSPKKKRGGGGDKTQR